MAFGITITRNSSVEDAKSDTLIITSEDRAELLENCAKDVSKRVDDTAFDLENKIVTIWLWDEESQDSIALELPYEPETDFAGCSKSAKELLRHIQELNEEDIRSGKK